MTADRSERTIRLRFSLDSDELAAVEEFKRRVGMPTRAAAVRELLRRGMIEGKNNRPPQSN
jgi:Ribbon-helix-helix protein, copG family